MKLISSQIALCTDLWIISSLFPFILCEDDRELFLSEILIKISPIPYFEDEIGPASPKILKFISVK